MDCYGEIIVRETCPSHHPSLDLTCWACPPVPMATLKREAHTNFVIDSPLYIVKPRQTNGDDNPYMQYLYVFVYI